MVGCQNIFDDQLGLGEGDGNIQITVGDKARALLDLEDGKSVTWEAGDKLGVIYHVNGAASKDSANLPYTATADGNSATFTGDGMWEGTKNDKHDFYVYFPYRNRNNTASEIALQMGSSQEYDAGALAWDLGATYGFAYAKVLDAEYGKPVVIGEMKQYLGVLRLNIVNTTKKAISIKTVTTTSDANLASSHRVDLTGDEIKSTDKATFHKTITTTVKNGSVAAGQSIDVRVAILPKDYSSKTFTITVEDAAGVVYPEVTFKGGKIAEGGRAVKQIELTSDEVEEEPEVDMSTLKVGDIASGGVVFWIASDKLSYKVVCGQGKKAVLNLTNSDLNKTFLGLSDSDGEASVAAMKNYADNNSLTFDATTFPAAYYCDNLVGDWYLPARDEMRSLFAAYVGYADWASSSGLVWANTATAREAFNASLAAAPIITNEDGSETGYNMTTFTDDSSYYVTSSETSSGNYARMLRFSERKESSEVSKYTSSTKRIVRCVKTVKVELPDAEEPGEEDHVVTLAEYTNLPYPGSKATYSSSFVSTYYTPISVWFQRSAEYEWESANTRILPYVEGFTRTKDVVAYKQRVNKYGSSLELPRQTATGRFYTKKIDGRWWIVDPDGFLHYQRGLNSFYKGESDRNQTAFASRFASDADWVATSRQEFVDMGFCGIGSFTPAAQYELVITHNKNNPTKPLVFTPWRSILEQYKKDETVLKNIENGRARAALVLCSDWEQWCMDYVKSNSTIKKYIGNRNVLGFFSDNEIKFGGNGWSLLKDVLAIKKVDETNEVYQAALAWCDKNGVSTSSPSSEACNKFDGYVAEEYYRVVSAAIHAVDPDMLYLGTRLHGQPKYNQYVIKAAGQYCDIVSINYYGNWSPTLLGTWAGYIDKPILITEFYTKGCDTDLETSEGAGFAVHTQRDRAYAYQHFTLGLLEATNCVGWHWFKYQDDDYGDKESPSNKGMYDNYYNAYPDLSFFARDINIHAYDLINFFDAQ